MHSGGSGEDGALHERGCTRDHKPESALEQVFTALPHRAVGSFLPVTPGIRPASLQQSPLCSFVQQKCSARTMCQTALVNTLRAGVLTSTEPEPLLPFRKHPIHCPDQGPPVPLGSSPHPRDSTVSGTHSSRAPGRHVTTTTTNNNVKVFEAPCIEPYLMPLLLP